MKKIIFLFQILLLSTLAQQNTKIKRSVTSTSNIDAQSDSYKIRGTFGQNVVGISSGQQLKISSGYWGWIAHWAALETDEELIIPAEFKVKSAYPNPFNPVTNIGYDIPEISKVSIDIYNIAGNKVKTLVSKEHQPGRYKVQWNATNESGAPVATGMYIYKIRAKDFVSVKKLLLMK